MIRKYKGRKWSDDDLREAVAKSTNMIQVVRNLNVKFGGYRYNQLKKYIERLGIDTSHFIKYKPTVENSSKRRVDLKEILVRNSSYMGSSSWLKTRLIREGVLREVCNGCSILPTWRGKPLSLQLNHVDGDNKNNEPKNLELLCPNCHSQTHTYAGKNRKTKEGLL